MKPRFSIIITAYNQRKMFEGNIIPALIRQTNKNFELVIADDGSSDYISELSLQQSHGFPIKCVSQEDKGYGYTSIVNKAVKESVGEYLIFLSGDTYPTETFIEEMARALKPHRVVNGLRVNVDDNGMEISKDWRLNELPSCERVMMLQGLEMFPVHHYPEPWKRMTMNTIGCSRLVWDAVDGLTPDYDGGYGRMDWSFCMKALCSNFELWWQTAAIALELNGGGIGRDDDPKNVKFFDKECELWHNKKKHYEKGNKNCA